MRTDTLASVQLLGCTAPFSNQVAQLTLRSHTGSKSFSSPALSLLFKTFWRLFDCSPKQILSTFRLIVFLSKINLICRLSLCLPFVLNQFKEWPFCLDSLLIRALLEPKISLGKGPMNMHGPATKCARTAPTHVLSSAFRLVNSRI